MVGRTISHYQILEKIGEGGMGVVYKARDLELGRLVAIKALRAEGLADESRRKRFLQEARTASALNHPNIITIHEIAHIDGMDCIVMEFVDGRPLQQLIQPQGLLLGEAVGYAIHIASALGAAHDAGIIHRDVKPANVLVSSSGATKVADFGLAKLTERASPDDVAPTRTAGEETSTGVILGTVAYMSPEQAQGERIDARSDLFSLGVVLYEMLTGRRPFAGDSQLSILMAILQGKPSPAHTLRSDIPAELERILDRALQKNRDARYASAAELTKDLNAFLLTLSARTTYVAGLVSRLRRPPVTAAALLVLLLAAGAGAWLFHQRGRVRWAQQQAIPEVARLAAEGSYVAAFDLATQAERHAASDPRLATLWGEISRTISVQSEPAGAEVYLKPYGASDEQWRHVGRTPMEKLRFPNSFFHWKFIKAGFETAYAINPTGSYFQTLRTTLHAEGSIPPGMVPVPAERGVLFFISNIGGLGPFDLARYFIDRYEVTNRDFKKFVDAAGYQDRKYWREQFVKGKRNLSWEEAMREFRDSTRRSGPSTWEGGAYPPGQDDFPVSGVSWYEAAAYAEFADKKLPTIAHWYRAAEPRAAFYIGQHSNFGHQGLARAGQYQGVGPFGTYDMAGNVKEWCWNESGDGRRYILGGAWSEPHYQFQQPDARSPWDRSATNGFRCARYTGAIAENVTAPKNRLYRDYFKEKPVSEQVFRDYASIYDYEPVDLKASVGAVDESSPDWRREKVTFAAAYVSQRVPAYLFLPKNSRPPYQAIVYHPGAGAEQLASLEGTQQIDPRLDFIIRSGRAVLYPVVQGTYERRFSTPAATELERMTRQIQRIQDIRRSFDYLDSRQDIDRSRLGYAGFSYGASPVMVALEPRAKVAVFYDGGLGLGRSAPEVDGFQFAPRVKIPVLMINGRYDFTYPLETSQLALFRGLGTPARDKRHVVVETSHDVIVMRKDVVREVLNWLDQYLGPVQR